MKTICLALSLFAFSGIALAEEAKPAPPVAAQPNPEAPKPAPPSDVTAEVKAGTGVEKREVVGEAATFPPGTTVWVWSRVTGAEGQTRKECPDRAFHGHPPSAIVRPTRTAPRKTITIPVRTGFPPMWRPNE